jgi:hypothetical protein
MSKNRRTPPTAALTGGIDSICGRTAGTVIHLRGYV